MEIKKCIRIGTLFVILMFSTTNIYAVGDGPRTYWAAPVGTQIFTPMWMGIDSNAGFDNSLILPDAKFDTDIMVLMYTQTISIGGHLGGVSLIVPGGRVDGELANTAIQGESSGLGDVTVISVISLFGAPAHTLETFASYKPETILDLLFAVTAPTGEYDSSKIINMGTNRWTFRLGMPFMHFFSAGPGETTSLELQPSVTFFTDNDDASLEQDAMFKLEAHVTHDFNQMFWGSLDALYTIGGETTVDGVAKDNAQRALGAGFTLGAYFSRTTGMNASYEKIIDRNEHGQNGHMIRVIFNYIF